jgi:uncharacterized protein with von Willebrand factor type A (vWA) domain
VLTAVEGLITELRRVGLPIRVSESIDAAAALRHADVGQRAEVKAALRACLVKDAQHLGAFDTVFDLYFTPQPGQLPGADGEDPEAGPAGGRAAGGDRDGDGEGDGDGSGGGGGGRSLRSLDDTAIRRLLIRALRNDDRHLSRVIAGIMVDRHARIVPGRPVAGTYYLMWTMQAVDPEALVTTLVAGDGEAEGAGTGGGLVRRLAAGRARARVAEFRQDVQAQIRRRLVADRGADAVARTLRTPLPEDINFLTASQQEVVALRAVLAPLARKLASRLARNRRHHRRGQLDFRRTVRESMSYGGVPAVPVFRRPRPAKPELVVLADISGSVSTFATFTLHLVSALRQEFAAVRSFVFVDGVDEVTGILAASPTIVEATRRINAGGLGVWLDGRSDYGHALTAFWEEWGSQLRHRSTVLVLGDARTNYHAPREDLLAAMRQRAGHLYWLNPEPVSAWNTGDSVIGRYAPACDAVLECRNVRQLRAFVETLG